MGKERTVVVGQTYLGPDHCVYRVIGIAKDVKLRRTVVVYEEHFGDHRMFIRDYNEFIAPVNEPPRGAEILYLYKMNECTVNHNNTITVSPDCIRHKEEDENA